MPSYNTEEANDQYVYISKLQIEYFNLNRVYFKVQDYVSKKQADKLVESIDIYLYWSAVATIYLYHNRQDELNNALKEAENGLKAFKAVLIEVIERSST